MVRMMAKHSGGNPTRDAFEHEGNELAFGLSAHDDRPGVFAPDW